MLALGGLPKHHTLPAALIFILVLHVCFWPFIWGDRTLLLSSRGGPSVMPNGAWYGPPEGPAIYRVNDPGGSAWQIEAYAPLIGRAYRTVSLPLWNPYQGFGAPLAANMHSQPFNPLFALYAFDPGPRTWNYFLLLRLLIAGLGAYLYLRLFLPFVPALAGGIVSMLAGYYILFLNMPHLSVEVLLPVLCFAIERLLRRQQRRDALLLLAIVFLAIAGGMPESALLMLTFGAAYFVFRLLSDRKLRAAARRHIAYFVFAHAMGIALAAFLLLPFVEFLDVSFDVHQFKNVHQVAGLMHDRLGLSVLTYIVPLLFGTAWHSTAPGLGGYTALRGYFGVVPAVLVLIAAVTLRRNPHRSVATFFLAAAIVVVLKRYGVPPVNWIGNLPLFQLVQFPKYDEPLLAFSVAALCAFGVDRMLSKRRPWIGWLMLALLTCELAGNYIYPVYYRMTRSASDAANPYRGAPYIGFLESRLAAHERVFGRDSILHPNWAGAFEVPDVRDLDAMYYWKYLRFVEFFLRDELPRDRSHLERLIEGNEHTFDTPLKRRLLELASVKYLLSMRPFAPGSPLAREVVAQNPGKPGELRQFTIDGDAKTVLYEHPPYDRLPLSLDVTKPVLDFDIALDPAVYNGSQPICGAGVQFRLEARSREGRIATLYERYIDPKHAPAERHWIPGTANLAPYLGRQIDLLFSTAPGPSADTCMAWAGWGDPHFRGDEPAPQLFREVYNREIRIFETPNWLPRAALYSSVELAANDAATLAALGALGLDIYRTAVVSEQNLSAVDRAAIRGINSRPADPVQAAAIVSYTPQQVRIEASAPQPALLVLNDSDYPGWKVYVDDREEHIITANYLFRGVLLSPGKHTVRFAYEPASVKTGAAISALGLLGFVLWQKRRSRVPVANLMH